jgi:hypothetical protein
VECPKCQHVIHINLTPEELVYCPYCNQRMIPPKDYNLCPACGLEVPLGAATCDNCAHKAESSDDATTEAEQAPPLPTPEEPVELVSLNVSIETASQPFVIQPEVEAPAVAKIEPAAVSREVSELPEEPFTEPEPEPEPAPVTPEPINEEPIIAPMAVETAPPAAEEPALRLPTIEELPWELAVASEATKSVPVAREEKQSINPIPAEIEHKPISEPPAQPQIFEGLYIEPFVAPEPQSPAATPEEPAAVSPMPEILEVSFEDQAEVQSEAAGAEQSPLNESVQEETPAHVEEAPSADEILRKLTSFTAPDIKLKQPEGFAELLETAKAGVRLDKFPLIDFKFCYACGQQLPSGALFCPRCGKSLQTEAAPHLAPEPVEAVKPRENIEPEPVMVPPLAVEQATAPPIPPVQPRYRPVAAREPVSVAMQDVAPSLPHFPKEKTAPDTFDVVWQKVSGWAVDAWVVIRRFARAVWIQVKVLMKPAPVKERPLIDLSSALVLKAKPVKAAPQAKRFDQTMLVYLILGAFLFIAIFIIIGIAMTR